MKIKTRINHNIIKLIIILGFTCMMLLLLNACKSKEEIGSFYRLQEAYDRELLAIEDLEDIAYYNNNNLTYSAEVINAGTAEAIKQNFVHYDGCSNTEHEIDIIYYGTYNDCVVVMIHCQIVFMDSLYGETVAGVVFHYGTPETILVWVRNIEK